MTRFASIMLALATSTGATAAGLGSEMIEARWQEGGKRIDQLVIGDRVNDLEVAIIDPFSLTLDGGEVVTMRDMRLETKPRRFTAPPDHAASRAADKAARNIVEARLIDVKGRFRVAWSLVHTPGQNYLRQTVTITALGVDQQISRIDLLQTKIAGAEVIGTVDGSPVSTGTAFFQFEHPLSKSSASWIDGSVRLWLDRALPLREGQSATFSAAIGVVRKGQLRRDFLRYVEAERAHPYRPFLHYNSWYDIGYQTPYTQAQALDRIGVFGEELVAKRGVKLDSFLFDDGWDDRTGAWRFNTRFPQGFAPLREAASHYKAAPGVWLSPWGGYDAAKRERVEKGGKQGFEIIDGGLALSGPRYFERFRDASMSLLKDHGVNQFKLDGTGNADKVVPGSKFNSDFDAAIALIEDLRRARPDLFINLTTGTYASPAWLRSADTIWRGGDDHAYTGEGTARQRWMTYRDRETYENIVVRGPLFPLNALMTHGIIFAEHTPSLGSDPGKDFASEVHSFFGSGTSLQELYITPKLLSTEDWDTLAAGARWARDNADVLSDTHWIGGNPGRGEVYGWAAWTIRKGIVTLRNPSSRRQTFLLDLPRAFELPTSAPRRYTMVNAWQPTSAAIVDTGRATAIDLAPFEVRTVELAPVQ